MEGVGFGDVIRVGFVAEDHRALADRFAEVEYLICGKEFAGWVVGIAEEDEACFVGHAFFDFFEVIVQVLGEGNPVDVGAPEGGVLHHGQEGRGAGDDLSSLSKGEAGHFQSFAGT